MKKSNIKDQINESIFQIVGSSVIAHTNRTEQLGRALYYINEQLTVIEKMSNDEEVTEYIGQVRIALDGLYTKD